MVSRVDTYFKIPNFFKEMGQSVSSIPPVRRKSLRKSFNSPFTRRVNTQGSLSATFNYNDSDMKVSQVNVNTATEEELMTLPGVSRTVAHNIVSYREAIGRFNKVEDLALVTGIGADRLEDMRQEICVSRRRYHGEGVSRSSSADSLGGAAPVDVNSASVFQLMAVRGINQELAAAIVDYRQRRGHFQAVDDLIKVKGMTVGRLSTLRPRLAIQPDLRLAPLQQTFPEHPVVPNGKIPEVTTGGIGGRAVFELVSEWSGRPTVLTPTIPSEALRLATWHLTDMCRDKAANPAVRETFCLTLLENKIAFLALQGVRESGSLQMLCDELKWPLCKRLKEWNGPRGEWRADFVSVRQGGGLYNVAFMYNTTFVKVSSVKVVQDNSMIRAAEATISFGSVRLSVLNVDVASPAAGTTFATVLSSLKSSILLGHFTPMAKDGKFIEGYRGAREPMENTSFFKDAKSVCCDNIFISSATTPYYMDVSGVIRSGLSHLAIPCGWNWNGPVSEHCPVWAQFHTELPPSPESA